MTDKTQAETLRQEYRATMAADVLHLWAKDALLLIDSLERYRHAYNEWSEKTEWVQETVQPKELGQHRADILRARIAELEALQAAPPAPAAVAVQPEDMRDKVTLALGLSLAPKGGPSFAWSYLLDSIRELVKCEEELALLKAGEEMSKARAALAAAPAQPAAWMTPEGDRVVTEATMASARKDGGAMLSSLRPFTVALARAAAPAQAQDDRAAFKAYLQECGDCAIVPDVAGAFNAGWTAATRAPAQEHATQLAGQAVSMSHREWRFALQEAIETMDAEIDSRGDESNVRRMKRAKAVLSTMLAAAPAHAQEEARDAGRWRHFSARGVFPKNVWNNGNGHWQYGEIRALTAEGVADAAIAARAAQGGA